LGWKTASKFCHFYSERALEFFQNSFLYLTDNKRIPNFNG
jgi:hypothetical protein